MRRCSELILAFGSCLALACSSASQVSKVGGLPRSAPHAKGKGKPARLGPLVAHRFAEVADVVGPYVGRDAELSLAVWAEASGNGRALFSSPIDARGNPGEPLRIGNVASDLDLVLVRGFGRASASAVGKPRFALVTSRKIEQKTRLDVTALDAAGKPLWGPTSVADRTGRVLWLGLVTVADKALVLWAEQATSAKPGEPAAIYSLPVGASDGQAPALLTQKACVWQVASSGGAAALASVKAGASGCSGGSVTFDLLDGAGKSTKSVDLGGRAGLDLDLVASDGAFVLAWSDRTELEPRAFTAVVDTQGAVRGAPGAAVPSLGEQAVLGLVPGSSAQAAAFLVWENLVERSDAGRSFEISALGANGRQSGAHARLLYGRADGGAPELVAYGGGVAALTLAPACSTDEACEVGAPVPTFVALDASLAVRASEPLLLDGLSGRAADLGWGLTCQDSGCFALAAPSRSPAPLFAVPLPVRDNPYRAAAESVAAEGKPRVVASDVLLRAPSPLSQIALGELAGRTLVGYITDFDPTTPWQKLSKPAEDGRLEPLRARIAARALPADGSRAPADEQLISLRAHSLGGLAFANDPANKDALALWMGLDKGEPQVFLTQLGEGAKRGQQRMLTRKSGDASDVTGLTVDGGYLVAWVDERSSDAEVYAARIGRALEKSGPEQRITAADGAASELSLTRVFGKPYVVWSDARGAQEPGWADIYGAFLRPSDAARDGGEHRLTNTRPHSFSPQLADLGATPVLAWLEEGTDAEPASIRLATLSSSGDVASEVTVVSLEVGVPRSLGLTCRETSCRVLVTAEAEGQGELLGFEWRPSGASKLKRLMSLGAPSAAGVAPLLRGDTAYVADQRDGRGLVRRLAIEW